MKMNPNQYAVIMAGGIGSRFWPMSRVNMPKQFIDILGIGQTLLQTTYNRISQFILPENIIIVTNKSYIPLVKEQLPQLLDEQILGEPIGRNTAPCIAYSTFKILKNNPDAIIGVYPSDHLVMNETQFKQDALKAMEYCKIEDAIFTLGINPTRPDTGYGYIQYIEDEENKGYYKEKIFTEKPPLEIAKTYIKSGEFVWNSGIFIFPGSLMVSKFKKFLPEMADLFLSIFEAYYTPNEPQAVAKVYEKCKNISIDFGIMEKASRVFVILSNFGWSDLGTWASLYEHLPKDYYHNTTNSQVVAYDSSHNIVKVPEDKICILKGLDNFIIVDTDDVLLICPKDQEQSIKDIVSDLKKNVGDQFL